MRFTLSDEQAQFAATLHDLLTDADTPNVARAWASGDHTPGLALWRRLAELGVTGLVVPESMDGLGAGRVDTVVAFEQLGRHAVPGPLVESLVVVPALLTGSGPAGSTTALSSPAGSATARSGPAGPNTARSAPGGPAEAASINAQSHTAGSDLAARWLPGIAAGKILATVALPPHLPHPLDADLADPVLVVDGDSLRLGRAGTALPSVDRTRRLFEVVPGETLNTGVDSGRALDAGALACAAQLLGAGRALLDMAVGYARQRHQFGCPIGSFQAVKHQLADVHVGLELARPLVYGAAVTAEPRDVSAAKVAAGDAAYRAARVALQVHGAIGYTAEHPLGLWLTKVRALVSAWGTPRWHRARIRRVLSEQRTPGVGGRVTLC